MSRGMSQGQLDLFGHGDLRPFMDRYTKTFGPAYDAEQDARRIGKQHEVIRDYMLSNEWRTLKEIEASTCYPQASISAQLRHLRKPKFGGWRIEKRRRGNGGLWEYRILDRKR